MTEEYIVKKYNLTLDSCPVSIKAPEAELLNLFSDLGFTLGAEVGIYQGDHARCCFEVIKGLHLICVDPWISYKEYYDCDAKDKLEQAFPIAVATLAPYNCTIVRDFSMNAVKDIPDNSLDFVFVDGCHSELDTTRDIEEWSKKVRPGGIISGHDYREFEAAKCIRVQAAVNQYTAAHKINPWFLMDTVYLWVKKEEV
jgi:SAM-dependent methyltransferase